MTFISSHIHDVFRLPIGQRSI